MKKIIQLFSSIVFIFILAGCSVSLAADVTPPPNLAPQQPVAPPLEDSIVLPMIEPDISNGAQIYMEKCAPCHGDTGKGDGIQSEQLPNSVPAIGDFMMASNRKPFDWYQIITLGNIENFMPGFQSLSDRERWDVTSYILTLSLSENLINVGEVVFSENCVECHTSENLPLNSASEMAQFSIIDIQQLVNDGVGQDMPGFAEELSGEEKIAVSSYVRFLGLNAKNSIISASESQDTTTTDLENTEELKQDFAKFNIRGEIENFDGEFDNFEVILTGYDGMDIAIQESTFVDENGSYEFSNLENIQGRVYQAGVIIEGMQHTSEVVHDPVLDSAGVFMLPIEYKKTSTDSSALYAERLHVFFEFLTQDSIQIVEMFVIQNPTDTIIIPADSQTPIVNFRIPSEAQNLQFEQGQLGKEYLQTNDGFGVMTSFNANSSVQLLYAYELAYSKSLNLELDLPLPVNASIFMIPSSPLKLESDQLAFSGERDIQGISIQTYSGEAMSSGSKINVKLSGKIKQSSQMVQSGNTTSIVIGSISLLVAISAAIYFFQKKKQSEFDDEMDDTEDEDLESLLDAVIALDDAFQSGEIPEKAYINRRNELTKQIKNKTNPEA